MQSFGCVNWLCSNRSQADRVECPGLHCAAFLQVCCNTIPTLDLYASSVVSHIHWSPLFSSVIPSILCRQSQMGAQRQRHREGPCSYACPFHCRLLDRGNYSKRTAVDLQKEEAVFTVGCSYTTSQRTECFHSSSGICAGTTLLQLEHTHYQLRSSKSSAWRSRFTFLAGRPPHR